MKKIINGKVYDTEKAECVGDWCNGYSTSDFNYCSETLYRKKTGEFFLYGEGGARTVYAQSRGNMVCGGMKIIPLTYEKAQKWAEEKLDGEEYEKIFGEIEEDESKTIINLYLSTTAVEKAKREAAKAGISLSAFIEAKLSDI